MPQTDKSKFSKILATISEIYGRTLTPEMTMIYWSVFSKYPIEQIEQAARKHVETAKFFPSPAELLEYIPAAKASQHIGADESWAIVIESFDEESTVVMTSEIAEARGVALPIYQSGDEIGARVAFRDAYNRIVKTASAPVWFISAGFDGARRADAIAKAISIGRLSNSIGGEYLLGNSKQTTTVAGLIESANQKAQNSSDEEFRKAALRNIGALKAMLNSVGDDGVERREKERDQFELHRQSELSKLAAKANKMH